MSDSEEKIEIVDNIDIIGRGAEGYQQLIDRNVKAIREQIQDDPTKVLVSVQLENDQIDHLVNGLTKRSRRLIPLTVLVRLIADLQKECK